MLSSSGWRLLALICLFFHLFVWKPMFLDGPVWGHITELVIKWKSVPPVSSSHTHTHSKLPVLLRADLQESRLFHGPVCVLCVSLLSSCCIYHSSAVMRGRRRSLGFRDSHGSSHHCPYIISAFIYFCICSARDVRWDISRFKPDPHTKISVIGTVLNIDRNTQSWCQAAGGDS